MRETFSDKAGFSPDDASDIGIRLKVLAGEIYSACSQAEFLKRQAFPQTAEGDFLDLHAQQRGISRKPAIPSSGQLSFTRQTALSYDVPIPQGTVCSTGGVPGIRFVTTQDAVLSAGKLEISVEAQSEEGGRDANTAAHTICVLVTPPPGIEEVQNPLPFTGGEDGETDESLRGRVIQSWNIIPNGTNAAFYRDFVLQYEGIRSVSVVPRAQGIGTVDIYAAGAGAAPDEGLLAQIQEDLQQVREINVDVSLLPCELVKVNLYAKVTPEKGFQMEQVRSACTSALQDYFLSLSIGQPVLLAAAGDRLFHTPGVKNYAFQTSLCSDHFLQSYQLAIPGEIGIVEQEEGS